MGTVSNTRFIKPTKDEAIKILAFAVVGALASYPIARLGGVNPLGAVAFSILRNLSFEVQNRLRYHEKHWAIIGGVNIYAAYKLGVINHDESVLTVTSMCEQGLMQTFPKENLTKSNKDKEKPQLDYAGMLLDVTKREVETKDSEDKRITFIVSMGTSIALDLVIQRVCGIQPWLFLTFSVMKKAGDFLAEKLIPERFKLCGIDGLAMRIIKPPIRAVAALASGAINPGCVALALAQDGLELIKRDGNYIVTVAPNFYREFFTKS